MVTIKTIAEKAGVSHTTVSRALNNSPLIKEETRAQIQAIADSLGYVPNLSARQLANDKSNNIGLFFSNLFFGTTGEFIKSSIEALSKVLGEKYSITIHRLDALGQKAMLSPSNYDGVVIVSMDKNDDIYIRQVIQSKIPCAIVNRKLEDEFAKSGVIYVYCQEKEGVYRAVEQIIKMGHRKIGYVRGIESSIADERRWKGFEQAMRDNGLEINENYICKGNFAVESGYEAVRDLLKQPELPTVLICASDTMAFGAMRMFYENGIRIPEDISIVGFDNSVTTTYSIPSLSSIGRPIKMMVEKAGLMLLQELEGEALEEKCVRFDTVFYERESLRDINPQP